MVVAALILTVLALAAFAGAWAVAAREGARAEAEGGAVSMPRAAVLVLWPFAARRPTDSRHARRAGKAQVALIVSVMVAVAAASAYTNLKRPRPALSAPAGVEVGAPNKS